MRTDKPDHTILMREPNGKKSAIRVFRLTAAPMWCSRDRAKVNFWCGFQSIRDRGSADNANEI